MGCDLPAAARSGSPLPCPAPPRPPPSSAPQEQQAFGGTSPGLSTFDGFDAPGFAVQGAAAAGAAEDDTLDVLQSLAALSRQLALDAAEDDQVLQNLERIQQQEAEAEAAQ